MTAAHCLDHATPSLLVAGDQNTVVVDSKNEQRLHVEKIIKHPNWSHEGIGINDIAIIKLQVPVEWKENVQPICLPGTKYCTVFENHFKMSRFLTIRAKRVKFTFKYTLVHFKREIARFARNVVKRDFFM